MDRDQCLQLIHLYSQYRYLWNPSDPNYCKKALREKTWAKIGREMKMAPAELKRKMESLLGSFRRERHREKKSRESAATLGDDAVYKSAWYAYDAFSFLQDRPGGVGGCGGGGGGGGCGGEDVHALLLLAPDMPVIKVSFYFNCISLARHYTVMFCFKFMAVSDCHRRRGRLSCWLDRDNTRCGFTGSGLGCLSSSSLSLIKLSFGATRC
ncbi:uncharacterized protein LOC105388152 [Plutella xylostella]|uniref:uncharacterized protein LOC105388152 n=1 Tax=Plutella xylostella TaxID=51655 RepID=UPI002032BB46|nr:uncharacterized protein LOC105388152 [Plutella xylostella]